MPPRNPSETHIANGVPRASDLALFAGMGIGFVVLLGLIYLTKGGPLLGGMFLAFYVGTFTIAMVGNRRRVPTSVGLSDEGIRAEFRSGRSRFIRWDELGEVRLQRFLWETYAALRLASGQREYGVHIYGEAAVKAKEWFDKYRQSPIRTSAR